MEWDLHFKNNKKIEGNLYPKMLYSLCFLE